MDAKLSAFEAVLSKTLEAVGRGRQKLHGRTAGDELGDHMAAQDAAAPTRSTPATPTTSRASPRSPTGPPPASRALAPAAAIPQQLPPPPAHQPDPYGYGAVPQPQDAYAAYQQPDPYAYQQQGYDPAAAQAYDQSGYAAVQPDPYAYQEQQQYQAPSRPPRSTRPASSTRA